MAAPIYWETAGEVNSDAERYLRGVRGEVKVMPMFDLAQFLEESRRRVDAELDRWLPAAAEPPRGLHEAMRYAIFAGGKRLRPALCFASAEAAGGEPGAAHIAAAALELLHTYTLVHDDLPAMDDDDLRRGRPTLHKAFGEANAILAGDALLTLAFEALAHVPSPPAPWRPGQLALELAGAAGSRGVCAGQYEDLAAEGRPVDAAILEYIHTHKTGRLIRAACRMGGIAAGAGTEVVETLGRFGDLVGLAFQIADDILNCTSTPEQLGKAVGSDAALGKLTYVAVHGLETARTDAHALADEAAALALRLPGRVEPLAALARLTVERSS